MRLSSSGSFPWKPRDMKVTHTNYRDSSGAKHSQLRSHQTKESKSNQRKIKPTCFSLARARKASTPTQHPPEHSPGETQQGCGAFAKPSARDPLLLPTICSVPGTLEQLHQLQVCSRNGPRGRWNLSSHEPQVGAYYNSNLRLGRVYSWGYFYRIINLSPLPE